jgi:hypothetical protein
LPTNSSKNGRVDSFSGSIGAISMPKFAKSLECDPSEPRNLSSASKKMSDEIDFSQNTGIPVVKDKTRKISKGLLGTIHSQLFFYQKVCF